MVHDFADDQRADARAAVGRAECRADHRVQIADRVGIMKQGRLVAVRERADFRHADLEEIYLTEMAAENVP